MKVKLIILVASVVVGLQASQPPKKRRNSISRLRQFEKQKQSDIRDMGMDLSKKSPVIKTNPHLANLKKKSPAFGN